MKERNLAYDNSFHKKFKKVVKNNKELEKKIFEILELMKSDIFDSKLMTHKLSGDLKKCYASKITFDLRIVFYFDEEFIYLVDVGNHDEVY